ncbi:MAG: hypothetical protein AB7O97_02740 [Planctomycetota bacterium]
MTTSHRTSRRSILLAAALATACATAPPAADAAPADAAATRQWLQEFGATYGYDVGYLEALLDRSPAAYATFAAAMGMAEHRVHLPADAHFVALISALIAYDCGQCTQLNLKMAVEAGVDRELLRLVLERPADLPPTLRLVHEYAAAVAGGRNADAATVARLRAELGDAAFGELAVNVLGAAIYPALRRAMGAETVCPPPTLDF